MRNLDWKRIRRRIVAVANKESIRAPIVLGVEFLCAWGILGLPPIEALEMAGAAAASTETLWIAFDSRRRDK